MKKVTLLFEPCMNLDSAVFYSNDIALVTKFYQTVLGFTLEYRQDDTFVSFIFPNGVRLGIKKKVEEREVPGAQTVFIAVDQDVQKLYEKLSAQGVEIYKKLTNQAWGLNFSILDPDKNKVQFVQKSNLDQTAK
jgi:predicted enzyme related to lactoylglutathione lyase